MNLWKLFRTSTATLSPITRCLLIRNRHSVAIKVHGTYYSYSTVFHCSVAFAKSVIISLCCAVQSVPPGKETQESEYHYSFENSHLVQAWRRIARLKQSIDLVHPLQVILQAIIFS